MGSRGDGWITVGRRSALEEDAESWAQQEVREREAMAAWDGDEQWPSV